VRRDTEIQEIECKLSCRDGQSPGTALGTCLYCWHWILLAPSIVEDICECFHSLAAALKMERFMTFTVHDTGHVSLMSHDNLTTTLRAKREFLPTMLFYADMFFCAQHLFVEYNSCSRGPAVVFTLSQLAVQQTNTSTTPGVVYRASRTRCKPAATVLTAKPTALLCESLWS
jgi:hypothetical protein